MLYLSGVAQRQFVFNIIEEDMHPQRFRQNAELGADVAVTDNPQFLAARFKAPHRQLIPYAAMRLGVGFRHAAQQQQQLTDHQLGHRTGIGEWRVKHRNTAFRGGVQIDLVGTDAEAADGNQFFRRGENLFSQVGTGTQADEMGITDRRFQLF